MEEVHEAHLVMDDGRRYTPPTEGPRTWPVLRLALNDPDGMVDYVKEYLNAHIDHFEEHPTKGWKRVCEQAGWQLTYEWFLVNPAQPWNKGRSRLFTNAEAQRVVNAGRIWTARLRGPNPRAARPLTTVDMREHPELPVWERRHFGKSDATRAEALRRYNRHDTLASIAEWLGLNHTQTRYLLMQERVEHCEVARVHPTGEGIREALDEGGEFASTAWVACRAGVVGNEVLRARR
jgi:hypothetical protein